MQPHSWVAIVTLVTLLVYVWMIFRIGGARRKSGIEAPWILIGKEEFIKPKWHKIIYRNYAKYY